jgi:hypothetical protein
MLSKLQRLGKHRNEMTLPTSVTVSVASMNFDYIIHGLFRRFSSQLYCSCTKGKCSLNRERLK